MSRKSETNRTRYTSVPMPSWYWNSTRNTLIGNITSSAGYTILGDDVGTVLNRTAYHTVAEGYGGKGILLTDPAKVDEALAEAKALAAAGTPVCINVHIASSDFRKGSLSM